MQMTMGDDHHPHVVICDSMRRYKCCTLNTGTYVHREHSSSFPYGECPQDLRVGYVEFIGMCTVEMTGYAGSWGTPGNAWLTADRDDPSYEESSEACLAANEGQDRYQYSWSESLFSSPCAGYDNGVRHRHCCRRDLE